LDAGSIATKYVLDNLLIVGVLGILATVLDAIHIRVVAAFSEADNDGKIIWWTAAVKEAVYDARASTANLGLTTHRDYRDVMPEDKWPTSGIWAWEGFMSLATPHIFEGEWRLLSDVEWSSVWCGENPCVVVPGRQQEL